MNSYELWQEAGKQLREKNEAVEVRNSISYLQLEVCFLCVTTSNQGWAFLKLKTQN